MKIHEYQAKAILAKHGVPVPRGIVAFTPEDARKAAETLGTPIVVVKAQIHAGGRGKGGGVKIAKSPAEAETLNAEQQAAVREFRRHYTNLTCLPAEFVERQTATRMRSEQLWRALRPRNDWTGYLPALDLALRRQFDHVLGTLVRLSGYR